MTIESARLRVAAAERELGDALRELNEELNRLHGPVQALRLVPEPPPVTTSRKTGPRLPPAPDKPSDEYSLKAARRKLEQLGFVPIEKEKP